MPLLFSTGEVPTLRRFFNLVAMIFAGLLWAATANAAPQAGTGVAENTIQSIIRAIGFLESAPKDGAFQVVVVYSGEELGAEATATDLAARLNNMPGPKRTRVSASARRIDEVLVTGEAIGALLLTPLGPEDAALLSAFVRERRVLSISYDRACIAADSCVLMIAADRAVEIILNTSLATSVGARFSTVFTMMVNRQ